MAILNTSTALIADVREIVLETTADFYTDAYILLQLKKADQILSTKLKLISTIWTVTLTDSSPGSGEAQITDNREIRLPSSYLSIDEGGVYYNDDVCSPTSIEQLKTYNKNWLDKTGTPRQYYLRGDMLGFDKQISAADTVRIYGIKMPAEIAASVAPFDGDYRTVGYRYLLVEYAVGMCLKKKRDDDWKLYLTPKVGSFWVGLAEMKQELLANADDDYKMIKRESPTRSYKKKSWPDWEQFSH